MVNTQTKSVVLYDNNDKFYTTI